MQFVLDTNILISALITKGTPPDLLYTAWHEERFILVTSEPQISEFMRVMHYPKLKPYIAMHEAKQMADSLRAQAIMARNLPKVTYSSDPADNYIIATAITGQADAIITGDKRDLLRLKSIENIELLTARRALHYLEEN